ncbi:phage tail protein [Gloeomargarita lithophora Alchichica-D10]|uniref:Phage tail protein n=1 Tax=Gloeomargarita lithophora Alchichica-D10 TaxID=1188229 RepID=A0A1J0A9X2_9CYAN|nr:phage tail protein [Gloeomargarita lithophora]APB32740.1 phage tail protein [Gloeomargarita lithophora Alchichica-D10]
MADTPEYLTTSRYYFEISGGSTGSQSLLISKCSGVKIDLNVVGEGMSLGVTKGARSIVQITPGSTKFSNVTLEFIISQENNVLQQWFWACQSHSYEGGGTQWSNNRNECSLVFYKQDGSEGARFNFRDAICAKYKSTALKPDSTDFFKETIEIAHAGLVRVT